MNKNIIYFFTLIVVLSITGCNPNQKIDIIFDTDANNEIDDQHALAYLFFNSDTFEIKGITTNATINGGAIEEHFKEAERIMKLCNWYEKVPLILGANGSFDNIKKELMTPNFDGYKAVNFIINEALKYSSEKKLIVLAVGKLTNIALAVKKNPLIIPKIRLLWLGSNYPDPGEYNLLNDINSMNFLLNTDVEFEMVTVRYGKSSGTDYVKLTENEVEKNIPTLGFRISEPVIGRHGGEFFSFGEYSKSLFDNTSFYGNPPSRSLFDMAAVAILKNPSWAKSTSINSPVMIDNKWVERPNNSKKIKIWEHFEKDLILADFYEVLTF
tara:strand:+ start:8427 stop:9404 length:978 start_codon:yes stop_codon:yes gene_type:complete